MLLMVVMVPKFGIDGIWISIFTAVSAFCNAGFDVFGRIAPYTSLTTFYSNGYVLGIVMLLIISGGLGFIVWQELFMFHRRGKLSLHAKLAIAVTVTLIAVGALAIGLLEWNNPATMGRFSSGEKVLSSLFQSVTCRTAGFNTIDQAGMASQEAIYLADLGTRNPVDLKAIVFAGILIGAVGAVMDVAMSLASALWELRERAATPTFGMGKIIDSYWL